jgi:hypothetical protein
MDHKFLPPGPLKLDATNLESEWRFWLQKFDLFMTASGGNEKPEATQLAMFLASIGNEGLKLYNTFDFSEADRRKLKSVQESLKLIVLLRRILCLSALISGSYVKLWGNQSTCL